MRLFEMATAGVPVSVPSRTFLGQLRSEYSGVLSQLTWFQVHRLKSPSETEDPSNEEREDFLDWWLDRADFYDPELMPNVRQVGSFDELIDEPHPFSVLDESARRALIRTRNAELKVQRKALISDFVARLSA